GASLFHSSTKMTSTELRASQYFEALRNELDQQQTLVNSVSSRVNAITKPLAPESQLAVQISVMRTDLDGLDKRLKTLEDAMIETPSKVLSVPLLRQEVESLKVNSQKDSEAQAKHIDRVY